MMRAAPLVIGALIAVAQTDATAQSPAVRKLGEPVITFDGELTAVSGVRELSDGRVIVLDAREKTVQLFDPRTKAATRIGREGSGPGEYTRPNGLMALSGDTTLIADDGNNRYLVLGAGGRILGTQPLMQLHPQPNTTYTVSVRAVDGKGRMYYALPRGLISNKALGTPLIRQDPKTQHADTVGYLATPRLEQQGAPRSAPGGATFGLMAPMPFAADDDFAVMPDGSVAFIRANPYRVEWRSATATMVNGPAIPYERIKVDEKEKEHWRELARLRGGGTLTTTNAEGKTTQQKLPVPEPDSWPEFKAPFSTPAALSSSDGRVWVARAMRAGSTTTDYDVFDSAGRLVERVTMPAQSRVVGFGKGTLYVTHKDEDDVLHLQQHRLAR